VTDRRGTRALALRALSDDALVEAMRNGDELAWGEFIDRFRPLLESFARRTAIPLWDWDTCITEVLDDVALRFVARRTALPRNVGAYLVRAVHNRRLRLKRAALVRERHYSEADCSTLPSAGYGTVLLCSESTLRASAGPDAAPASSVSGGLAQLARLLQNEVSEEELLVLTWRSAGVPLRQVAAWLGVSYDAAAKRAVRLSRRLRAVAQLKVASLSPADRRDVDRFLRRLNTLSDVQGTSAVVRRGQGR
jgi:hypothetical protein